MSMLLLWIQHVLENLKFKVYNDERYLNTPKDEDFKHTEIEPFQQPLPEAEHVIDTPSISGKIVGIKNVATLTAWTSCGKLTQPYQFSTRLGQCQGCNLIQILNSCDLHRSLRLLVKASDHVTKRNIMLYHQQVLQLLTVLDIQLDLNSVPVEEHTITLLQEEVEVQIYYEGGNNKLINILRLWTCFPNILPLLTFCLLIFLIWKKNMFRESTDFPKIVLVLKFCYLKKQNIDILGPRTLTGILDISELFYIYCYVKIILYL